jgi:hypothetical protein
MDKITARGNHHLPAHRAMPAVEQQRVSQFDQDAALEAYSDECAALRAFAQEIMQAWPEGGIEGDDLQRIAVRHGLLTPQIRHEPCGETCLCAEVLDPSDWEAGARCYRKTPLLTGE